MRTVFSALFNHIQAHFEPCVTLAYTETCYIRNLEYSKPFHNSIPTHIQNIVIFTAIAKTCVTVEIENPGILTILEY